MEVPASRTSADAPRTRGIERVSEPRTTPLFSTQSDAYRETLRQLDRYARCDEATVVLVGETGTGKNLLARRLHEMSPRSNKAFHVTSLALLNESLAPSELFGHLPGAFTDARQKRQGSFQTASGGTLFLDEIAKTPLSLQKLLLRALESGEIQPVGADRPVQVDVRVVAASNKPLAPLVDDGTFLPDLYSRLGAFRICVPALRDRPEDIPALTEFFLARHASSAGYAEPPSVHPELMRALVAADWPFNLRQLDATLFRVMVDAEGAPELTLDHCIGDLVDLRATGVPREPLTPELAYRTVREMGQKKRAAIHLGVARTTLDRMLAKHDREMPAEDPPPAV
jgi:DNA-binding NtrC family response regulator